MNWKPGDRALIRTSNPSMDTLNLNGQVVTLLCRAPAYDLRTPCGVAWDIGGDDIVAECVLYPIDDYDGHQVTTWDKCIWEPDLVPVEQETP